MTQIEAAKRQFSFLSGRPTPLLQALDESGVVKTADAEAVLRWAIPSGLIGAGLGVASEAVADRKRESKNYLGAALMGGVGGALTGSAISPTPLAPILTSLRDKVFSPGGLKELPRSVISATPLATMFPGLRSKAPSSGVAASQEMTGIVPGSSVPVKVPERGFLGDLIDSFKPVGSAAAGKAVSIGAGGVLPGWIAKEILAARDAPAEANPWTAFKRVIEADDRLKRSLGSRLGIDLGSDTAVDDIVEGLRKRLMSGDPKGLAEVEASLARASKARLPAWENPLGTKRSVRFDGRAPSYLSFLDRVLPGRFPRVVESDPLEKILSAASRLPDPSQLNVIRGSANSIVSNLQNADPRSFSTAKTLADRLDFIIRRDGNRVQESPFSALVSSGMSEKERVKFVREALESASRGDDALREFVRRHVRNLPTHVLMELGGRFRSSGYRKPLLHAAQMKDWKPGFGRRLGRYYLPAAGVTALGSWLASKLLD
ncbi:MAG: hypothetical protein KatS3mg109_0063 [Pirellulaceae bacterium]|nr:MAG: hypothetical protein KatS3mg109_0063 [Pirellulaceae bacterium]